MIVDDFLILGCSFFIVMMMLFCDFRGLLYSYYDGIRFNFGIALFLALIVVVDIAYIICRVTGVVS